MQRLTASRLMALMAPILVLTIVQAAALAHGSPTEQQHHRASRLRRDVPDILLPDVLHDGRRKRGVPAATANRPGRSCVKFDEAALQELARLLNDAELSQAAPTSLAKRFFDSLVRPVPINNGRRKRFLDSLVPARSIYNGKRKRFYDSLVRPSSFFNRAARRMARGDLVRDGEAWCPI
ncbi:hypothetical protein BOX15_Mlig029057g2 [Macrostomum lignano]|uniref:Uncharacterized protein n=2 Tax=Macrostomum lignano TaxID=282301 RepID=A0A1I8GP78_9PLAT|nr:hypothetical protein BOX15_Mlig029057g2 [Macrostomum lignano]